MNSGIYKITNIINGNIYIGLSKKLNKRFNSHKSCLRKNKHDNLHLQRAWNKYGESSFLFEILEECEASKLGEREKFWIDFYGGYESSNLYNMREGGEVGNTHTKEVREKISKKVKGRPCCWKGKHLPLEMVRKIRDAQKGRKLSPEHKEKAILTLRKYWKNRPGYWTGKTLTEEHRQKLRISHLGQKSWNKGNRGMISEETRQKLRISHLGCKQTEEAKRKISIAHKGKVFSAETRRRLSEANKGQVRYWLNKDGLTTTVPFEKINEYLSMGWQRGKGEKRIWINNGQERKMILEKELIKYDTTKWKRGKAL